MIITKEYNNEQYQITLPAGDHTSKENWPAGHLPQLYTIYIYIYIYSII